MDITLKCCTVLESLNNQLETITSEKLQNCHLSLWRNEFREIVLSVTKPPKRELKFLLQDIKIHSNFMKEGKSTIVIKNSKVRLLLSNCPPSSLKQFFQILSVKLLSSKKKVSKEKRLNMFLPSTLDEISPLNEKDLACVNEARELNSKKILDINMRKRKQPFSDLTNCKKSEIIPFKKKLSLPSDQLNFDQNYIISLIKQRKNVFFTGSAGTGKSYLLRYIIGMLPPSETYVTASTGVAACHIGGMTLHSFCGFNTVKLCKNLVNKIKSSKAHLKHWMSCRYLIIDEISMIDGDFFDSMESVARTMLDQTKPFGGIQLIICGDFFQLPPISKNKEKRNYCFQARSWHQCIDVQYELKKVYRQKDSTFLNLLEEIRFGKCTSKTSYLLKATHSNNVCNNGIVPTKLCTHVEDVKQINQLQLSKLESKEYIYYAQDSSDMYSSTIDKSLPDTNLLKLKVGAQIMLTKNINVAKKLVNGARGIVVAFTNDKQPLPIVKFLLGVKQTISVENFSVKLSHNVTAVRKQLPLKLAWAISIHKSQGMSLDIVEVSLSRVFESGQAYVALSRATSLAGLCVLDFDPSCIRSDIDVLRFYRKLREKQCCINSC